jgi:hypothetical protein
MSGVLRTMTCDRCGRRSVRSAALTILLAALTGCGTTRMSDSKRTATEQLLVSQAIDRAVMRNAKAVADTATQDPVALAGVVDLSKPKAFANPTVGGDVTPRPPTAIADQRTVDLPTVR